MPFSSTAVTCSYLCALAYVRVKEERKADKAHLQRKREFRANDIKLRKKVAQSTFNAYIRKRDEKLNCISCDKPNNGQHQRHASHYKSTAARSDIKFNEDNVHASCMQCNSHLSGNIQGYTPRLIEKIGLERFHALELETQIKWTCEMYKEIELKYKTKLKQLT